MHRQMPSIQRIWSGPGWFGTRRSMVQIHSPRPLLLKPTTYSEEKCRRHPDCVPRDRWFKCPRPTISISLCKLELSGVTLRLRFPHFVAHVAQTGRASAWQVETEAYFLAAFLTVWDVFEKSFRSKSSCCLSHGPIQCRETPMFSTTLVQISF